MNSKIRSRLKLDSLVLTMILCLTQNSVQSASLVLSSTPLFITPTVAPNIMVIFDNSQSMDAYMGGSLISGNNPSTRGNIGRQVMRDVITAYRSTFNWGLMSFGLSGSTPNYDTYAFYMGSDTGMNFTSTADCVGGGTTPGADGVYASGLSTLYGKRCIRNPQPFLGGEFVTYDKSGDDVDILDVLYVSSSVGPQIWALSTGAGSTYKLWFNHNTVNSWLSTDFSSPWFTGAFTPTDAGFLPANPPYTRQVFLPRVQTSASQCAFNSAITGYAALNEAIAPDSATHYSNLMSRLASETCSGTGEIKNAALYTPLRGSLISTRQYFAGTNGYTSPITSSCQKNFAVLVTDGLPTGTTSGTLYSTADRTNTYNATTGTWSFGTAAQDAINAVCGLRLPYGAGSSFCTGTAPIPATPLPPSDITTYVLALSDSVANPAAVAVMNAMASSGGTTGAYFASDATTFRSAFTSIAADILGKIGAAAAVATNSSALITGSTIYQAKFTSTDWSGQVLAFPIDPITGVISSTPSWQGGAIEWIVGSTTYTQSPSARVIFTYKPSTAIGIPFVWPAAPAAPTSTELDASQVTALNTGSTGSLDGLGSDRLAYLRGVSSNEGTGASNFRIRSANKLGDIVDSSLAYVAVPNAGYPDALESASYAAFRKAKKTRTPVIYAGANDGMLHGFDAASGKELMAYVPSRVYGNLSKLTARDYAHKYFVNGSPTVADVFYSGAWHTILVGSLGQGGQSIFALDITDPSVYSETTTNAQTVVRWEFNDLDNPATTSLDGDADLGYTLSQPTIGRVCTSWSFSGGVKSCPAASSKWVAIFGNGYNNTEADGSASTTGHAVLYVVDISNGNLMAKFDTLVGTTSTPNGLASPLSVDVDGDYYVDYVYAGDLQGNMWKFDLTPSTMSSWTFGYGSTSSPQPLYQAKDGAGVVQPITSRPSATAHTSGDGYLIYFGTGKYLEPGTDVATTGTQTQTFYGIWDNSATVSSVTTRNSTKLQQQVIDAVDSLGKWRHTSKNTVDWSTQKGWYMDLCLNTSSTMGACTSANGGEKQVSNSLLLNGRIIFTTLVPDSTGCYGGDSWIMELGFENGGRTVTSPFDINGDGKFSSTSDVASFGGSTGSAVANGSKIPGGIAGAPVFIFNPNKPGGTGNKINNTASGSLANTANDLGVGVGRVSWRELLNQ